MRRAPTETFAQITAGLLAGAILVLDGVSVGALVFAGPLSRWLPQGIALGLVATFTLCAVVSLRSSFRGTIATLQDSTAVMLSAIAVGVAGRIGMDDPRCLPSILVAVSLATLVTGLFLFLIGRLRLGRLVRFIPYPVVGGFLAGTGWLIITAAMPVIHPHEGAWAAILADPRQLVAWAPGIGLALILLLTTRRVRHALLVPGLLLAATALFYVGLWSSGLSLDAARAAGLLFDRFQGESLWSSLPAASLGQVDWGAVLSQGGTLGALLLIAVISVLLNASALELEVREDFDMDQELRATGLGNMLAGALGGIIGFHGIAITTLTHRMGARGRLPALIAAGVLFVVISAGAELVGLMPRMVVGGLLLYLGLAIVFEWVIDAWSKLPRVEYALLLIIAGTVAFWDFLPGVAIGFVSSLFVFAARYSRIDFVKYALTRTEHQSHVERAPRMDLLLARKGELIRILCLQGFLFFGTSAALYERIRALLRGGNRPRFLVLDFRLTSGLDASAALSFTKIRQFAQDEQVKLLFCGLPDGDAGVLTAGGCTLDDGEVCLRFSDLDHGLAWCEDCLVDEAMGAAPATVMLGRRRSAFAEFPDPKVVERLFPWMQQLDLTAGTLLGREGDLSGALYFVASGKVTVWVTSKDGARRRLVSVGPGNAVGGIEYMRETPPGVTAVADEESAVLALSQEALDRAKRTDPALVVAFQEMLLRVMADRLAHAQRELATLFG